MKIIKTIHGTKLWLSANDTYLWATKPGASWPCSQLSGRRLFAEFAANGDIIDLSIDGGRGEQDCDNTEFGAIVADFLGSSHPLAPIVTSWEWRTYDVWGNAKDGYEVNDSYRHSAVELELEVTTYNPGKDGEFIGASPTDKQIKELFGVRCQIETDGDDTHITVNRARDGYPIGELTCVSHESLSPIRKGHPARV